MGLFDSIKRSREAARRERANEVHQNTLASWTREAEELRSLLDIAQEFRGFSTDELVGEDATPPVILKKGERVFLIVQGVALVEPRRGQGHYKGGYSGFSFRIMKGVRYHVGGSRGTYVQGEERPTLIDEGVFTITNQRAVFQGTKQSREWTFSKMIGYQHDPSLPMTMIQVSNRQKVSGVVYDSANAEQIQFRLALATAVFADSVDAFTSSLKKELAQHEATRPQLPPA